MRSEADITDEQLKEHLNADPTTKALIFSGFVGFLQVAQQYLDQQGVKSILYTGQMGLPERERALQAFKSEGGLPVLLISLKAGSTGLNLTAANLVLIAEPDWNPTHEMQAMDRVHRIVSGMLYALVECSRPGPKASGQGVQVCDQGFNRRRDRREVSPSSDVGGTGADAVHRQVEKKELAMAVYGCD